MKILGVFDSLRALVVFIALGAVVGLVVRAATGADAGWGASAGLGAVGGIAIYYVGHALLVVSAVAHGISWLRRR